VEPIREQVRRGFDHPFAVLEPPFAVAMKSI
jgi:hypothetical protein